jgi:hypothetical protein
VGDRFVARNSPRRNALLLFGTLLFVAGGLSLAGLFGPSRSPGREWMGWACAVFFGMCAAAFAARLFDREDWIVVDRNGIRWRQWSEATIPWSTIRSWSRRSFRGQQFICLVLKDPSQFPGSGSLSWFGGVNKALGFGDIALNVQGTDRKFDELEAAVRRFAALRR